MANLEIFSAGFNLLETVPEGITRCGKLKKLLINNNKLITLPAGIHFMPELKELDIRNNPSLVMPPKPEKVEAEGRILIFMTSFFIMTSLSIYSSFYDLMFELDKFFKVFRKTTSLSK